VRMARVIEHPMAERKHADEIERSLLAQSA
jgi:hypothetical protein